MYFSLLLETVVLLGANIPVEGTFNNVPILESKRHISSTPKPEPIDITELPLPPVTANDEEGGCTSDINSRGTGCIGISPNLQNGNFLPDGNHVTATLNFTGAPAAPDERSIYVGQQLIVVKVDGSTFPNGDAWKCLTCGVPVQNMVGSTILDAYPQAFHDGKRVLVGTNIVDCGLALLASADCTPDKIHIYPIRWNVQSNGTGPGGNIRELRVHPDNVHLGFNAFTLSGASMGEFSYFGHLVFNPSPTAGTPLTARYDLVNVTMLFNPNQTVIGADGDQLIFNPNALRVGEFRGFTGRGNEITYLGQPVESCNFDVFAADLTTGKVRRITSDPGYTDPIDVSPDDKWQVILTTLQSGRMLFLSAMRGVPPITDLITSASTGSVRNNGQRRFFQPWLLDHDGDRGSYIGQLINSAGDGSPGSINDPNWNAGADPRWSPDGTSIVYFQNLVKAPACGGQNPLPCPNSTAPGGRTSRLMLARLTGRQPLPAQPVTPVSDEVPWGIPYIPGSSPPSALPLLEGNYTLKGNVSGTAHASFTLDSTKSSISSVAVIYSNYSDDGINRLNGFENVTATPVNLTLIHLDWFSDLTSTGKSNSTKVSSPDGFHLEIDQLYNFFNANGTLETMVDGVIFKQPPNGA